MLARHSVLQELCGAGAGTGRLGQQGTGLAFSQLVSLFRGHGGNRRVFVKRDDLLQPINGNKARKLAWLSTRLQTKSEGPLVCFGGNRSNMLPALSKVATLSNRPCHFWTNQGGVCVCVCLCVRVCVCVSLCAYLSF